MYHVNLVLHGVFAVVLDEDSISVRFPYYGPHEYLLGCWDQLQPMPKGSVSVVGLDGIDHCRPNPDFSAQTSPTAPSLTQRCDDNLFCCVELEQYPSAVHLFRPYSLPSLSGHRLYRFPFIGVHGDGINLQALYGPMVLCYQADDPDDVALIFREKPLHFVRVIDEKNSAMNLHFFGEGETDLPPDRDPDMPYQVGRHYTGAWSQLTTLIGSLDIRLDKIWPFVLGSADQPHDPTGVKGLPASQLWDLDELFKAKHGPTGSVFGGVTDCDKAHVVIDNRPRGRN